MILALNLLVSALFIGGILIWWKTRKNWVIFATCAIIIVYTQAQPSYMPKGEIKRSPVPALKSSESEIQDRNSRPMSVVERDKKMDDAVKRGLPFKE